MVVDRGEPSMTAVDEPLARLVSHQGSDEINNGGTLYRVRPDGGFIVPRSVADLMLSLPVAGFVEKYDEAVQLREIKTLIAVLPPGAVKTALNAALTSLELKVTPA
jgi:hypothetical protein